MDDEPSGETEDFQIWGEGTVVVCCINTGAEPRSRTGTANMACSAQFIVSCIRGDWAGDLRMLVLIQ
jgi:hypothetical protein